MKINMMLKLVVAFGCAYAVFGCSDNTVNTRFEELTSRNSMQDDKTSHISELDYVKDVKILSKDAFEAANSKYFTNGVVRLADFRVFDHRVFGQHKLIKHHVVVEIKPGDSIIIPHNQFIAFEYKGDEYVFNYWCHDNYNQMLKNAVHFDGYLDDDIFVTVDCGGSNSKTFRRDKDNCHIKFHIKKYNK